MENQKINKMLDNYHNLKYKITPFDTGDETEIVKLKNTLIQYYDFVMLDKVKINFNFTAKDTLTQIEILEKQRNNLKLGKFYLGCVYRDFYFSILGNTSVTCTFQEDENSKITSEILKSKINSMKNKIDCSADIIEVIGGFN